MLAAARFADDGMLQTHERPIAGRERRTPPRERRTSACLSASMRAAWGAAPGSGGAAPRAQRKHPAAAGHARAQGARQAGGAGPPRERSTNTRSLASTRSPAGGLVCT